MVLKLPFLCSLGILARLKKCSKFCCRVDITLSRCLNCPFWEFRHSCVRIPSNCCSFIVRVDICSKIVQFVCCFHFSARATPSCHCHCCVPASLCRPYVSKQLMFTVTRTHGISSIPRYSVLPHFEFRCLFSFPRTSMCSSNDLIRNHDTTIVTISKDIISNAHTHSPIRAHSRTLKRKSWKIFTLARSSLSLIHVLYPISFCRQ